MVNLPVEFTNRMKEYLGEEYDAFMASYEAPEVKGLRLNTLAPRESLGAICNELEDLGENINKIPWMDMAYSYVSIDNAETAEGETLSKAERLKKVLCTRPGKHPYHEAGAYYIQEPSAMAPVVYLDVRPGDRVLDLCAAPGGKSTEIAACLKGEGILISNEIMSDRARILSENIERMGVRNALVISEDPRNISDKFAGFFDKVLVDAPCSGEGMFRRSQTAIDEWSPDNVKLCADRQEWILDEAAKMLAPNGTLVYSTCTFSKEEDEMQVISFLDRHEDFYLDEMKPYEGMSKGFSSEVSDESRPYGGVGVRLFPHKLKGEGHYICKLRKKGLEEEANDADIMKIPPVTGYEPDLSKNERTNIKEMFDFLECNIACSDFMKYFEDRRLTRFKDQIYLLPKECPSLKGLKVLRPGLHLGTILKNRFEPSHALAMALNMSEVKNAYILSCDSREIYKYFNGETFNIEEEYIRVNKIERDNDSKKGKSKDKNASGWYVIFVDGFSAGWGKLTNCIMKNHYPKGLRKNL